MSFFLVLSTALALGHAWLGWRWLRAARPGPRLRRLLALLLLLGAGAVPAIWLGLHRLESEVPPLLAGAAFLWMGILFYLVLLQALADLLLLPLSRLRGGPDPERRRLLARGACLASAGSAAGIAALGLRSALGEIELREVVVPLERLPRELDGFHLVQVSDLHLGPVLGEAFCRRVAGRLRDLRPDLLVATGDLVDGPPRELAAALAPLGAVPARFGRFAVTGNHEFYAGARPWLDTLPRLGLEVLANRRVAVGDDGASFDLAGLHDPTARAFLPAEAPDPGAILRGRDPGRELVLLAHQPRQVEAGLATGAGLQLSGHTHGGQLQPFGLLTGLVQPYLAGLHRHEGRLWIYVSRGTGFWGPPLRVLAPAEITSVRLVCA